ncbi:MULTISPECIES: hypothetical protein [Actinomycetes]|uniref:hypothetical protein n=1 Tax=Actinomycetes TaxID=1760 RepID=UPI0025DE531F|nr:hypothetical protein [Microbacterium sp. UBA837]
MRRQLWQVAVVDEAAIELARELGEQSGPVVSRWTHGHLHPLHDLLLDDLLDLDDLLHDLDRDEAGPGSSALLPRPLATDL